MSIQKRKRTEFTLKQKEIIDAAKKEPNQSKLAREMSKKWGIEVNRTTVKGIISKKDAIEAAIKAGVPSKRMKLKSSHHSKLDDGVLMWLKQARGQNLPVCGDLIKEKALKLAELMHIPNFMASNGWLDNLKRHGITLKQCRAKLERWIRNPFLSGNNRFSSPYSGSSPQTTYSTWTRLDSSGVCFRTRP